MKFYIVDAFTESLFGGNPAGVVILPEGEDFPSDEICIKTAAELRYSETAFIKRIECEGYDGAFNIRYFTPAAEVELCGHATIASFTALKYGGHIGSGKYLNRTLSGDLEIEVSDKGILMDMASPVDLGKISGEAELSELYGVMGLDWHDQKGRGLELLPQIISTGLPDIMLPVLTQEDLNEIAPDFKKLAELSERYEVVGVHAFTLEGDDASCHTRNFAPLYDIDEEAATGTSSGALTYYGLLNGFVKSGDECKFIQGEAMNRPSVIRSNLQVDGDEIRIRVGGAGAILAEGELRL